MKPEIKQRIAQLNNGEIPDGYKKTEFGIFPCDWETDKTFGDLFDFYGGLSKSRDELGDEGYPYLHYGDLHRGSFNKVSYEQYTQLPKCDIKLKGKETCLMEDGDIAFLDASEDLEGTSRAALIDNPDNNPFIAGLHIIYGKSKGGSLEKWYKQYITSTESVKKQFQRLAAGFKVYGVNRDSIPRIRIAYPPTTQEQSRIAEILMTWDKAIELYQQQIEKLNKLKRSALANLFPQKGHSTPKYRFAGFTDPWEQRKLGELGEIMTGSTPSTTKSEYYSEDGLPWVTPTDIDSTIISDTPRKLSEEGAKVGRVVPANTILCTCIASIGKNALLTVKGSFNQQINSLTPYGDNDPYFLLTESENWSNHMKRMAASGTMQIVNKTEFSELLTMVPRHDEQKKIGKYFRSIDNLITLHQRKVETTAHQRAVLQQYLLNGIVRVKT